MLEAGDRVGDGGGDEIGPRRAEADDDDPRQAHEPASTPASPPPSAVTCAESGLHSPIDELTQTSDLRSSCCSRAVVAACWADLTSSSLTSLKGRTIMIW